MLLLRDIPAPTIVETLSYEEIVQRKSDSVKRLLDERNIAYTPSEADDLMTLIEMDAYEEMLLRSEINIRIRQLFLAYATESNLDHIGTTRFGVARLVGKKPVATVSFTLSMLQESDVVIPSGTLLGDGTETAVLLESVIIKAGNTEGEGEMELQHITAQSETKCETILTPLPWVVEASQLTPFANGADREDDERYRERLWLSRERRTTAGSEKMYLYYAKSADVRVEEVAVINGGAGMVRVVVFPGEADIIESVEGYLNKDEIRPLTDTLQVEAAKIKPITIEATLIARSVDVVDTAKVEARFAPYINTFGAKLTIAKIYDLLGDENIVDVELVTPVASMECGDDEVMQIVFMLHVRGEDV